jgi:hypothetical protein
VKTGGGGRDESTGSVVVDCNDGYGDCDYRRLDDVNDGRAVKLMDAMVIAGG